MWTKNRFPAIALGALLLWALGAPSTALAQDINVAVIGTASQSTTGFGGEASRAIDGNTSGIFGNGSMSHTAADDPAPSWEVDLGEVFPLTRIVLWNRTECCAERLSNFRVLVLDDARGVVFSGDFFTDMTFPGDPSFELALPAETSGRFVRVEILGPNSVGEMWLSLAEVQAFAPASDLRPIITRQPASARVQISTSASFSVEAEVADSYQWTKGGMELPGETASSLTLKNVDFDDAGVYQVVLTNGNGSATSAEAELVVTPPDIARSGVASQSTTGFGGEASRAIDGNTSGVFTDGSMTHTDGTDVNPWWEVDLGRERTMLLSIVLWNRTDCCAHRLSNFRVQVLGEAREEVFGEDYFTDMSFPDEASFEIVLPENTSGRYVRIVSIGPDSDGLEWVSLAEVEIFAEFMPPQMPAASTWALALLAGLALGLGGVLLRARTVRES